MLDSVTVIVPHIPTRIVELERALASVWRQTHQPDAVIVQTDNRRVGSALTRNRALCYNLSTNWVAFLDDDDELLPNHLEVLLSRAARDLPGVVYSGCRVVDRFGFEVPQREEWGRFGQEFNADLLRRRSYIPVTSLVSVYVAQKAFFEAPAGSDYDDWGFYLRALDNGARFVHVPEVTWIWHHHGHNTSGRPDRW